MSKEAISNLLTPIDLLECCWMMIKTSEKVFSVSSQNQDEEEEKNLLKNSCFCFLSSIWKLASTSLNSSSTNNNNHHNNKFSSVSTRISILTKLSPIAKERLISIAVEGMNIMIDGVLSELLSHSSSSSSSSFEPELFVSHSKLRTNLIQESIDFLGTNYPSFVSSFVGKVCESVLKKMSRMKIETDSTINKVEKAKEEIDLIDFTLNLISSFLSNNQNQNQNNNNNSSSSSIFIMICQLKIVKSKIEHKILLQNENALQTLSEVEIRIRQKSSSKNSDIYFPLLCSVFGFRFKIHHDSLTNFVPEEQLVDEDSSSPSSTSSSLNFIQNTTQKAFDTLNALFNSTCQNSSPSSSMIQNLRLQVFRGVEALLSLRPESRKILLFSNHHQVLIFLLQLDEKNVSSTIIDLMISLLCEILNSNDDDQQKEIPVLQKITNSLIKKSSSKKEVVATNERDAEQLLATLDEEDEFFQNDQEQQQIEQESSNYSLLWQTSQKFLVEMSLRIEQQNQNEKETQDEDSQQVENFEDKSRQELCLALLRLCTLFAKSFGGNHQKAISLRALARAEMLFASESKSALERAQKLLDEAKDLTKTSIHSCLLQFQLHFHQSKIRINNNNKNDDDENSSSENFCDLMIQDLDEIISCSKVCSQTEVREGLEIAAHLVKNDDKIAGVCLHALKNLVDVEIQNFKSGNENKIISLLGSWLQMQQQKQQFLSSKNKLWLSEIVLILAKNFEENQNEDEDFLNEFQFWIAELLSQENQEIVVDPRIFLNCVLICDSLNEKLSEPSSFASRFAQLLRSAASEFLLRQQQKAQNEMISSSVSLHESLLLIQLLKKSLHFFPDRESPISMWLHFASAEISLLISIHQK